MNDSFFLDTNLFVYTFSDNSEKGEISQRLIDKALSDLNGKISVQVVQEFLNVVRKQTPDSDKLTGIK